MERRATWVGCVLKGRPRPMRFPVSGIVELPINSLLTYRGCCIFNPQQPPQDKNDD